jgi:hypothetical protein
MNFEWFVAFLLMILGVWLKSNCFIAPLLSLLLSLNGCEVPENRKLSILLSTIKFAIKLRHEKFHFSPLKDLKKIPKSSTMTHFYIM